MNNKNAMLDDRYIRRIATIATACVIGVAVTATVIVTERVRRLTGQVDLVRRDLDAVVAVERGRTQWDRVAAGA